MPHFLRAGPAFGLLVLAGVLSTGCAAGMAYVETAISDRRTNMLGLETLFLDHIDAHPEQFPTFIRLLTDADNALHAHRVLTRAMVLRWIDRRIEQEGWDEHAMPGIFFLRKVYLEGWHREYFTVIGVDDREFLSDIISAVMGALHKCRTCTTHHGP